MILTKYLPNFLKPKRVEVEKQELPKWYLLNEEKSVVLNEEMCGRPDEILVCELNGKSVGRFRFHTVSNILSAENFSFRTQLNKVDFVNVLILFIDEIIKIMKERNLEIFDGYIVEHNIAMVMYRLGASIKQNMDGKTWRVKWRLVDIENAFNGKLKRQLQIL
jgi:hypothetical protein